MPPPEKPCSFGTADLSADELAEMDPDYLYFLRHLRPEGSAYAVEIPSKDGSSAPRVVRYEEPLTAPNAESSAAGSDSGTRSASFPMEDSSAAVGVPSGAASPPAGPDGEASSGGVPVEGDGLPSSKEDDPSWYDSVPDMDEDYRTFLQHCRVVNDSQLVFEMGNFSMTLGEAPSVGNCEDDGDEDADGEDEEDGVEDVEIVSASRDNTSAGTEEGNEVEDEKPVVAGSNLPTKKVITDIEAQEVDDDVKIEKDDCEQSEGMDTAGTGSDLQFVNAMAFETKVEVDEEEQPLNGMTPEPSNREASSRQGHSAIARNASDLGVIWPTHITERPESDFKRKLMKVLMKPFNQEEYDELFAMATDRTPVIKERRTRRRVMYYPWKHEMGKSYFDSYPDLANQVEGTDSYANRLALLRGLFFWLENVGHDEQFRPWRGDYKRYRVFYFNRS